MVLAIYDMPLTITDPHCPAYNWLLFDVLAGWDEARICAGLRNQSLTWAIECDLAGHMLYLLMTQPPRRVIATAVLN